MKEVPFRTPVQIWDDGTYITVAQLELYMSTADGYLAFEEASNDYFEYIDMCRAYNLVYDALEEDESLGIMYWENDEIRVSYPKDGPLFERINRMEPIERVDPDI